MDFKLVKHAGDVDITNENFDVIVTIQNFPNLYNRRCIVPTYELIQTEPIFQYRINFTDKDGILQYALGSGKSRKEAKRAATKSLVDKLSRTPVTPELPLCNNRIPIKSSPFDDEPIKNAVVYLEALCRTTKWPSPVYLLLQVEDGLPGHDEQFSIQCSVAYFREIGKGKSKKIAKHNAAHKMLPNLQKNPSGPNDNNPFIGYDSENENNCSNNPNVNYKEFLQTIAMEQHFEVTYIDIQELTHSGYFLCLIQLTTLPVAVCQGTGVTQIAAQSNAARAALDYLMIVMKINPTL